MANTYKALQTVTVGAGGASSISFTNIPQTYTDLKISLSTRSSVSGQNDYPRISFNGSAANQTLRALQGNGSTTASYTDTLIYTASAGNTVTANTFGNSEFYIPNYTSNSNNKSVSSDGVNENNATGAIASLFAGLWSQTAPITSITIIPYNTGETFLQYSTATLYGVFNADVSSAPATPTIGTATATGANSATVAFTGVSNAASYTATSTPGSLTATGTTSPLTVSGLTPATSYTFKVKSNNPFGSSADSAASNSITTNSTAFESIATVSVGSGGASSISFTSIPSTYTHLQLRGITRGGNETGVFATFNGTGGNGHAWFGRGNGSSVGAFRETAGIPFSATPATGNATENTATFVADILDYANTNKFKTTRSLVGLEVTSTGNTYVFMESGLWQSTSAITSIVLTLGSGNFAQFTHIALYGIKGA